MLNIDRKKVGKLAIMATLIAAVVALTLLVIAHKQNSKLNITDYTVSHNALPQAFEGMVIAQVSDYHGDSTHRETMLRSIAQRQPDLIVITGDLFDPEVEEESLDFALHLAGIAPTYFVVGNHEARVERYVEMEMRMRSGGVKVLRNEVTEFVRGQERILIAGADDEYFWNDTDYYALCEDDDFTILLSHRPDDFEEYVAAGAELVFSGHVHGGQFCIPGTKFGLITHGQGLIGAYTQGVHTMGNTTMVVSRGIANVYVPPRFCKPPELVYVTLRC